MSSPYFSKPVQRPAPETLPHAVARMRAQGYTDQQIKGQVGRWHPDWNTAKINAVVPVRSPGSLEKANPNLGKTATKPFYPGQKPDHYIPVGRGGSRPVYKYGLGPTAPTLETVLGAPAHGETEAQSQAALGKVYRQNHPVGQQVIQGIAEGVPGVAVAKAVRDNRFGVNTLAHEAFNDISSGIVPVGKTAGVLAGLRGLKKAKDTAEALDAAKAAEAATTVEKTATEKIQGGLQGAKIQRGKQNALYSAEKSKRVAAGEQALQSQPGMAGFHAALAEHRGPLPKINFKGFGELTPENLDQAAEIIKNHPSLEGLHYSKIRVAKALEAAVHEGKVPTPSDLKLIEHVFGKETTGTLSDPTRLKKWATLAGEIWNLPRAFAASVDASGLFRQALVAATRHPTVVGRNFGTYFKAIAKEKNYTGTLEAIHADPMYPLANSAGLAITDLEHGLGATEENFSSLPLAEKLTGGKKFSPIRMSGRGYTAGLDKIRFDVFKQLIRNAQSQGIDIHDEKFLKDLGKHINNITGRGSFNSKTLEQAMPFLNHFFFSPRLLASRFNILLNPHYYLSLDPFVRREALKAAFSTLGTGITVLGLASLAGAKVGLDPRSADFGKIRLGNTRIDIWGGFQQPARLLAQIYSGKVISSTTGKTLHLGPEGPGNLSRGDIIQRFFASKLSPSTSLVYQDLFGQTQTGGKFKLKPAIEQSFIPLVFQDAHDLYKQNHGGLNGIEAALAGYGLSGLGIGVQTYGPKQPKSRGGSGGSGSPYFGQPASAPSSDGYFGGTSSSTGASPYFSP